MSNEVYIAIISAGSAIAGVIVASLFNYLSNRNKLKTDIQLEKAKYLTKKIELFECEKNKLINDRLKINSDNLDDIGRFWESYFKNLQESLGITKRIFYTLNHYFDKNKKEYFLSQIDEIADFIVSIMKLRIEGNTEQIAPIQFTNFKEKSEKHIKEFSNYLDDMILDTKDELHEIYQIKSEKK